jgi:hypothetical protein
MRQQLRIRKLCALAICMSLAFTSLGIAGQDKSKKEKPLPPGTPILWREPTDIESRDLYLGPGGESMKPDLSKVTLIRKESGGYSTKYRVRDGSGREWVAKIGKESQAETAAVRLMWAVGYFADVNYLVPQVRVEGLDKTLENVRFGARPKDEKRFDGWKWDDNPFVGTREFQGLKIMMALLNNWDIKDTNNKIVAVRNDAGDYELRYLVHDLGGTFGKVSSVPRVFQFKPDRNNPKEYEKVRLIDGVKEGRIDFHYSVKRNNLFKDITLDDAQWLSTWLSRLSDKQIEDAFRAANYSPEEIRMLADGLRRRINELVELPKRQQAAR